MSFKKEVKSHWYVDFFEKYYLELLGKKVENFDIRKEINFICDATGASKGRKILDLACGTGRHSVELAERGFTVYCLDLNKKFLEQAQSLARAKNITLHPIHSDMRIIPYEKTFDIVINMFSSFGYFEDEKENMKVLQAVAKNLKPNGIFLLDMPNKEMILKKSIKKTWQKIDDLYVLEDRFFDNAENLFHNEITIITPKIKINRTSNIFHLYDLPEIDSKLKKANFHRLRVYGDYDYGKYFPHTSDRMIIVAQNNS